MAATSPVVVKVVPGQACVTRKRHGLGAGQATVASDFRSIRSSVTIPATLVSEMRRVAKERHVTMSRALVSLAVRGVRAEAEAKEQLKSSFNRFPGENDPTARMRTAKI